MRPMVGAACQPNVWGHPNLQAAPQHATSAAATEPAGPDCLCRDNSAGELGCDRDCPTVTTVTDDIGRSFQASFTPIKVAAGQQKWRQVSAAIYFTCATTVEGTAKCWVSALVEVGL